MVVDTPRRPLRAWRGQPAARNSRPAPSCVEIDGLDRARALHGARCRTALRAWHPRVNAARVPAQRALAPRAAPCCTWLPSLPTNTPVVAMDRAGGEKRQQQQQKRGVMCLCGWCVPPGGVSSTCACSRHISRQFDRRAALDGRQDGPSRRTQMGTSGRTGSRRRRGADCSSK